MYKTRRYGADTQKRSPQMKIAVYERELKLDNKLCVAVDVRKARLDCYNPFDTHTEAQVNPDARKEDVKQQMKDMECACLPIIFETKHDLFISQIHHMPAFSTRSSPELTRPRCYVCQFPNCGRRPGIGEHKFGKVRCFLDSPVYYTKCSCHLCCSM